MRAMKVELLHGADATPLVVRATSKKTFLGLGAFTGAVLLLGGSYLMVEALIDPLHASDASVITAGFALALSSFLLVYFVYPRRRMELAKREFEEREEAKSNGPILTVYGETVQNRMVAEQVLGEGKNLPGPM